MGKASCIEVLAEYLRLVLIAFNQLKHEARSIHLDLSIRPSQIFARLLPAAPITQQVGGRANSNIQPILSSLSLVSWLELSLSNCQATASHNPTIHTDCLKLGIRLLRLTQIGNAIAPSLVTSTSERGQVPYKLDLLDRSFDDAFLS